jgi:hypothetical protein
MGFKLSSWWKDLITKLLLLYSAFGVFGGVSTIIQAYFSVQNPLIPDYLGHHMAFPYFFLVPLWAFGVWFYYSALKTKKYQERQFWVIPVSLLAFWGLETIIIRFSIVINPFG